MLVVPAAEACFQPDPAAPFQKDSAVSAPAAVAAAVVAVVAEPRLAERQYSTGGRQSRARRLAGIQACETSSRRVPFHSALTFPKATNSREQLHGRDGALPSRLHHRPERQLKSAALSCAA